MPVREDPVYRNYSQEALDAQYNLRVLQPDYADFFEIWEAESARVRKALPHQADVAYGDSPLQTLDAFPATTPGAPLHMFIHGGILAIIRQNQLQLSSGSLCAGRRGLRLNQLRPGPRRVPR